MTVRNAILPALLIAIAVSLDSCTDILPTSYDRNHIMPLATGNRWVGEVTEKLSSSPGYTSYADTIEIVASERNESASSGLAYIDQREWRHYYVGRELFRTAKDLNSHHRLTSPYPWSTALYPAEVSDTFATISSYQLTLLDSNGDDSIQVDFIGARMVMNTDTLITVKAGTFHCYHYSLQVLEPEEGLPFVSTIESYYSPGIGLVLYENLNNPGSTLLYRWELTDYTITEN